MQKKTVNGIVGLLFFVILNIFSLSGQGDCAFVVNQAVPDNGQTTFEVEISGLQNPDLGGGQAVCAVRVRFRHNYLGDLTLQLESPSGQSIKLIGETTDQINPTNLITWDVTFLPCMAPASPDPGFSNTWDNEQPWQVLSDYTGSYYPNSGCLQDFDSGSANGIWIFTAIDADLQATGIIEEVEIIFCDDTGIVCSVCTANAGRFVPSGISICEGDVFNASVFDPKYQAGMPSDSEYGFQYLVSSDGQTFDFYSELVGAGWAVGNYTICGISFIKTDSIGFIRHIDTLTLSEIRNAFDAEAVPYCADISTNCFKLEVHTIPDTTYLTEVICSGQSVIVAGNQYTQTGIYTVNTSSQYGCDSVIVLDLYVEKFNVSITQFDTLSCENNSTLLDASGSGPGLDGLYAWSTTNGVIASDTSEPIVTISAPGLYSVTVTDQSGCTSMKDWIAIADGTYPLVSVTDGVLTCSRTIHRFKPVTFPGDVSFSWIGPGGFTSNAKNPPITMGGEYVLTVEDTSGCAVSVVGMVEMDTAKIPIVLDVTKVCDEMETVLTINPFRGSMSWTGPGGFFENERTINVSAPGTYNALRVMPNGCESTASFNVTSDYIIPNLGVTATSDTLNCAEQITLSATSATPGNQYRWISPGGQHLSADSTLTVTQSGVYTVEILAPNLCPNEMEFEIFKGDDLFEVSTFTDTINCHEDTVLIGALFNTQANLITWTGPGLVDSNDQFVRVFEAGDYTVQIIDSSGCIATASVAVESDLKPIAFRLEADTISCSNKEATLRFITPEEYTSVRWERDGAFLGSGLTLEVDYPGVYQMTLTGVNGCERRKDIEVQTDTIPGRVYIAPAAIGCQDSSQIFVVPVDSIVNYNWSGPAGFSSNLQNPFVYSHGSYALEVIGLNGCPDTLSGLVADVSVIPNLQVANELLDCIDSIAILSALTQDTSIAFNWFSQGTMISDSAAVAVKQPGMYHVLAQSLVTECVANDSVMLEPAVIPEVYASDGHLDCRDSTAILQATSDSANVVFTWYDQEGTVISNTASVQVNQAGTYEVQGVWLNGCSNDTFSTVTVDTVHPVAIATTDEEIRCDIQVIVLDGTASVGDSLAYRWSASPGEILAGADMDSAFIRGQGVYILHVTDQTNNCASFDTLDVAEMPSTLESMDLTIVPECQGNGGGVIQINSVMTQLSNLMYSVGPGTESDSALFNGLTEGEYTVTVIDSFGCSLDSTVSLTNTSSEATVNLGPDLDITIGDQVTLQATLDVDSNSVTGVNWTPDMPCDSCLTNTVENLLETQSITIQVSDLFGCVAVDEITVYVAERGKFYVPNIFSPNEDGTNDVLEVYAHPGISLVNTFVIYDRWGNLVFEATNYQPGSSEGVWDGTFGGASLNPAVYTYLLELELVTGRQERHVGNVTLVR